MTDIERKRSNSVNSNKYKDNDNLVGYVVISNQNNTKPKLQLYVKNNLDLQTGGKKILKKKNRKRNKSIKRKNKSKRKLKKRNYKSKRKLKKRKINSK